MNRILRESILLSTAMAWWRFRVAYFGYFIYLGTWGPHWTTFVRDELGFSEGFAGLLALTKVFAIVGGGLLIAPLADAFRCRQGMARGLSLLAVGSTALWLVVKEPWQALLLMVAQGALAHTHTAFIDATVIDGLAGDRKRYGSFRLFGTAGYLAGVLLIGAFREGQPIAIVWGALLCMAGYHVVTWLLPDTQPAAAIAPKRFEYRLAFRNRPLLLLVACNFVYGVSYSPYEIFGAVHFGDCGLSPQQFSVLLATGLCAEIVVFFLAPRFLVLARAQTLALFAVATSAVRWWVLPFLDEFVPLALLQLTHGLGFGLWCAAALHILPKVVPQEVRTTGQAMFSMAMSLGFGVGAQLVGMVRKILGPVALFHWAAGLAVLCFVILWTSKSLRVPLEEPPGPGLKTAP